MENGVDGKMEALIEFPSSSKKVASKTTDPTAVVSGIVTAPPIATGA
jgi:hypothetical protein